MTDFVARAPAMRATLLTLALVCLAAPAIATDLPDGRVVELNELNFDAGVAKGPDPGGGVRGLVLVRVLGEG